MQPPCEIMVSRFLPNMRGLIAHELHGKGESQRRIAVLLGITQARVSHYLGKKKSIYLNELSTKFGVSESEVQSYARILCEDVTRSQSEGIFTLYSIWKNLLFAGAACSLHQKESGITSDCSVCMELQKPHHDSSQGRDSDGDAMILRDLTEATSMIESSATFPNIMPEVSVNIAMSRKDPRSARDIAAIPGRINQIHGRAKAFVLPEFGSSNHMSNVLLIFNSKNPELRAVMNLKYDKLMDRALTNLGISRIFTPLDVRTQDLRGEDKGDPVVARLHKTPLPSDSKPKDQFAVVDRGSEGVEPITYLLGKEATELAQIALKVAHSYSNL